MENVNQIEIKQKQDNLHTLQMSAGLSSLASLLASIAISIDYGQKIQTEEQENGEPRDDLRDLNTTLWGLYGLEVVTMVTMYVVTGRARRKGKVGLSKREYRAIQTLIIFGDFISELVILSVQAVLFEQLEFATYGGLFLTIVSGVLDIAISAWELKKAADLHKYVKKQEALRVIEKVIYAFAADMLYKKIHRLKKTIWMEQAKQFFDYGKFRQLCPTDLHIEHIKKESIECGRAIFKEMKKQHKHIRRRFNVLLIDEFEIRAEGEAIEFSQRKLDMKESYYLRIEKRQAEGSNGLVY